MPPRKKNDEVLDLADFRELALEGLGGAGRTIRLENDQLFLIPHPMLLGDDQQIEVERVQSGEDLDEIENAALREELAGILDEDTLTKVWLVVEPHTRIRGGTIDGKRPLPMQIRLAKAALGDDEYRRFKAGGGSANLFAVAWQDMARVIEEKGPKLPR